MTSQLQETINLARSLPLAEQRELLNILSVMIQQTDSLGNQTPAEENNTDFSAESFSQSWQQAITGKTLPISQLWEGIELD
ncbi:MAG: hypothetical protein HC916_07230 [Coleofasciculaceae cyanobacterium SM2_1_6]|nr:hypothetical protein [Coleofasciculaceae cyanobacterium SM2_1_6]